MSTAIPAFASEIDAVRDVLLRSRDDLAILLSDAHENYPHTDLGYDHQQVQALTQAVDLLSHYADGYR